MKKKNNVTEVTGAIASFPKHRHRVLLSVCLKVPLT